MDRAQVFIDITFDELDARVKDYCARGWRFANLCGSTVAGGVELIYSFSDNLPLENLRFVTDLSAPIPSVSDCFPNAFFFENETHDLFGVEFSGISIDFDGSFYTVAVPTPMNPAAAAANLPPTAPAAAKPPKTSRSTTRKTPAKTPTEGRDA